MILKNSTVVLGTRALISFLEIKIVRFIHEIG